MNNDLIKFGENLKKIRIKNGLTQKEVEELTYISLRTLSRIENGQGGNPSLDILLTLSNLYKEDIVNLFIFFTHKGIHIFSNILEKLDIDAVFLEDKVLDTMLDNLNDLEDSFDLRNRKKEITLTKIFISSLKNNYNFIDDFEKYTPNTITEENIFSLNYSLIELRILVSICYRLDIYKHHTSIEILEYCANNSKATIVYPIAVTNLASKYYIERNHKKSLEILAKGEENIKRTKYKSSLSYIYYSNFLNLYELKDDRYKEELKKALFLSSITNEKLHELIEKKSRQIIK